MMQLESGLARFYYEKKEDKERNNLINTLFSTVLSVSTFVAFFVIVFANPISSLLFQSNEYSWSIIYCALTIPAFNIYSFLSVLVRFEEKSVLFIIISTGQLLIMLSLSILLSLIHI